MVRLIAGAALGRETAEPIEFKGMAHIGAESGVDHYAAALLKFEGDILAQISCGVQVGDDNITHIYGSKGNIKITSPWFWSPPSFTVSVNGAEPREEKIETDKSVYVYEVDAVAAGVAAGRAPYPAMTPEDTLGNMTVLDRWRRDIGLTYDEERITAVRTTHDRKPLRKREGSLVQYGRVPGVDKDISRLVMGTMLEGNILPVPHAHALFDAFFEFGGNCYDSAYVYGSEGIFGQWLKNRPIREEIALIVKGAHTPFCTPEGISQQLAVSLERLGTEYADIYMMHRDNLDVPVGDFVEVLNQHKNAGRIRAFGGSNWSLERVDAANQYAASHGLAGFSVVSNNFSLARMVTPVWPNCIAASDAASRAWFERTQTPLFAWSSQARGFFVRGDRNFTADADLVKNWYSDDNFDRLERVVKMAAERKTSPINIACAYVLAQPFPTFALVGPRTIDEVRTTFHGFGVQLSPAELKYLNLED
jgi:aryl-alcohol dehydrogenase-like predicted oxidoreductase